MPFHRLHLLRRQRGPARGHHVAKARRRHADRVHVAFHQDHAIFFTHRLLGAVEVVEDLSFDVQVRLRRVDVLRLFVRRQRASAEGDDLARFIVNRKHQPIAKGVVEAFGPTWATARWTSPNPWAPSLLPRAKSWTTSPSSSTAICSAWTVRCAATAR